MFTHFDFQSFYYFDSWVCAGWTALSQAWELQSWDDWFKFHWNLSEPIIDYFLFLLSRFTLRVWIFERIGLVTSIIWFLKRDREEVWNFHHPIYYWSLNETFFKGIGSALTHHTESFLLPWHSSNCCFFWALGVGRCSVVQSRMKTHPFIAQKDDIIRRITELWRLFIFLVKERASLNSNRSKSVFRRSYFMILQFDFLGNRVRRKGLVGLIDKHPAFFESRVQ